MVVIGVALGFGAFYGYQIGRTFQTVASEEFDPDAARSAIGGQGPEAAEAQGADGDNRVYEEPGDVLSPGELIVAGNPRDLFPTAFGDPIAEGVFDAYLLLGVDASGSLADAIILVLEPTRGGRPIMVSLPRDLWVWNACRDRFTRLNEGLGGCRGVASGSELMAIMVEDFTGIKVDHLARINFDGFAGLVDALGGVTICVDYPTRDVNSGLNIDASGCRVSDGATALAWVRSRNTEQLVGGRWTVTAGSDFVRQRRQQDVLFQLAGKASRFSSPLALTRSLGAVSSSIRLNSTWSFGEAVGIGWRHRGITSEAVTRFQIDVRNFTSAQGARVLVPDVKFNKQLAEVFTLPDY